MDSPDRVLSSRPDGAVSPFRSASPYRIVSPDLSGTPETLACLDSKASSEIMVCPDTRVPMEGPAVSPTPPPASKSKGSKSVSFSIPVKPTEPSGPECWPATKGLQEGTHILTVEELRRLLPASFRNGRAWTGIPENRVEHFLVKDLNIDRLTEVLDYFFMLGNEKTPPRALHYQQALGQEIFVTERMDMHLLWSKGKIFIKPLPRYLLDSQFWKEFLECPEECSYSWHSEMLRKGGQMHNSRKITGCDPCKHSILWMRAFGFAFSYIALIAHESDFKIAKSKNLVPHDIDFEDWKCFVSRVLGIGAGGGRIFGQMDKRFTYGELDLERLNTIYMLRDPLKWLFQGNDGQGYFQGHFFMPPLSIYVAVVLVSMQVKIIYANIKETEAYTAVMYGIVIFWVIFLILMLVQVA